MASNGYLGASDLKPAVGGVAGPDPGQGQLANDAADAWNAMDAYWAANHGVHLSCNGADSFYRPYSRQVYWRNYWCERGACENAAIPGTSNHGLGIAGDVPPYVQAICDAPECDRFGFNKRFSDAPWEDWHRKYGGIYDGPTPGPVHHKPRYPTLKIGDKGGAVKRAQKHLRRWNDGIARPHDDGDFGKKTLKAVEQFQIVHGLEPDGVIGKSTWAQLRLKDHLLDDERAAVNTIRLAAHRKGGMTAAQKKRVRKERAWCARRAKAIRKVARTDGWEGQHRHERFTILKQVAAGQFAAATI